MVIRLVPVQRQQQKQQCSLYYYASQRAFLGVIHPYFLLLRLGQQLAEQAAGEHGQQHHGQKPIVFQYSFLFHRPSPFRSPLYVASAGPGYVPG